MRMKIGEVRVIILFTNKKIGTSTGLKTIHTRVMTEPNTPRTLNIRSINEQNFIESIIDQYPEVFRECPGKIKGYECKIRLKDRNQYV